eukprot:s2610_g17.t1
MPTSTQWTIGSWKCFGSLVNITRPVVATAPWWDVLPLWIVFASLLYLASGATGQLVGDQARHGQDPSALSVAMARNINSTSKDTPVSSARFEKLYSCALSIWSPQRQGRFGDGLNTMTSIDEETINAVPGIDDDSDDVEPWAANLSFPDLMEKDGWQGRSAWRY